MVFLFNIVHYELQHMNIWPPTREGTLKVSSSKSATSVQSLLILQLTGGGKWSTTINMSTVKVTHGQSNKYAIQGKRAKDALSKDEQDLYELCSLSGVDISPAVFR